MKLFSMLYGVRIQFCRALTNCAFLCPAAILFDNNVPRARADEIYTPSGSALSTRFGVLATSFYFAAHVCLRHIHEIDAYTLGNNLGFYYLWRSRKYVSLLDVCGCEWPLTYL